jgi:hypothetical protein
MNDDVRMMVEKTRDPMAGGIRAGDAETAQNSSIAEGAGKGAEALYYPILIPAMKARPRVGHACPTRAIQSDIDFYMNELSSVSGPLID